MSKKKIQTVSIPEIAAVLKRNADKTLRVTFHDGEILILTDYQEIDPSIYDQQGGWCATLVQDVTGRHSFRPGCGVDILEQDVAIIEDASVGVTLFKSNA